MIFSNEIDVFIPLEIVNITTFYVFLQINQHIPMKTLNITLRYLVKIIFREGVTLFVNLKRVWLFRNNIRRGYQFRKIFLGEDCQSC